MQILLLMLCEACTVVVDELLLIRQVDELLKRHTILLFVSHREFGVAERTSNLAFAEVDLAIPFFIYLHQFVSSRSLF